MSSDFTIVLTSNFLKAYLVLGVIERIVSLSYYDQPNHTSNELIVISIQEYKYQEF